MQREIIVEFKNSKDEAKNYTLKIPTAGQLVDIENYKSIYTQGNYGKMVLSGTVQSNNALDLVDMNSNLRALCPDLLKEWNVDDLFSLDVFDIQLVKKVYDKTIAPWIEEWSKALKEVSEKK